MATTNETREWAAEIGGVAPGKKILGRGFSKGLLFMVRLLVVGVGRALKF